MMLNNDKHVINVIITIIFVLSPTLVRCIFLQNKKCIEYA
jgi:hypothetical protein